MSEQGLFCITDCFTKEEANTLITRLNYPKELMVDDEYGIRVIIPERSADWEVDDEEDEALLEEAFMRRNYEIHCLRRKISEAKVALAQEEGRTCYVLEKSGAAIFLGNNRNIIDSELRRLAQWSDDDTVSRCRSVERALIASTKFLKEGILAQDELWLNIFHDFIAHDYRLMYSFDWVKKWSQSPLLDGVKAVPRNKIIENLESL